MNTNYLTNLSFKLKNSYILNINKTYNIILQLGSQIIHDYFVHESIFRYMKEFINMVEYWKDLSY